MKRHFGGFFVPYFPFKKNKELLQQVDWVGGPSGWHFGGILYSSPKKETQKNEISQSQLKHLFLYRALFHPLFQK